MKLDLNLELDLTSDESNSMRIIFILERREFTKECVRMLALLNRKADQLLQALPL